MNIIFEKTSGLRSGGSGHEGRSHHAPDTPRDSIQLAERSSALGHPVAWSWGKNDHASILSTCAPFERSEPLQSALDCIAVLFAFLFVTVTGIGIAAAFAILFFVSL